MRFFAALAAICALCQPALAQSANTTFFVTSNGPGKGADLGGIEGADKQCQTLAAAAGFINRLLHDHREAERGAAQGLRANAL